MRDRNLFRAIVLSGTALVTAPGCSSTPVAVDAGRDAPMTPELDAGPMLADAGSDAPSAPTDTGPSATDTGAVDAGDDAMVLIL